MSVMYDLYKLKTQQKKCTFSSDLEGLHVIKSQVILFQLGCFRGVQPLKQTDYQLFYITVITFESLLSSDLGDEANACNSLLGLSVFMRYFLSIFVVRRCLIVRKSSPRLSETRPRPCVSRYVTLSAK